MKKIILYSLVFDMLGILYFGGAYYFSSEIIDFKSKTMEEDRIKQKAESFSDFQLPNPEDVTLKNENIELAAWYFPHPSPQKNCGVVLVHGFTGTRWGVMKYAPIFWKLGCSIFAYDHRKHGESDGRYGTFGYYEKFDLEKAMEEFSKLSGLDRSRIGVLGESLGGATALQAASLGNEYAFVIAESPYKDLDSIVGKKAVEIYGSWVQIFIPLSYWLSEVRGEFLVEDVSPIEMAKNIHVPVLLIHSATDAYTPVTHSEEIFPKISSTKKKLVVTDWGSKHARSINDNFPKFESIVLDFLKTEVPKF